MIWLEYSSSGGSSASISSSSGFISSPIIKKVKLPVSDQYAYFSENICSLIVGVLIEYDGQLRVRTLNGWESPVTYLNETMALFNIPHRVPVGSSVSVSFQAFDDSFNPQMTWDFDNYATLSCDPVPNNLIMTPKQNKWQLVYDIYRMMYWIKAFEVNELTKSLPYDAFTCTVPQNFQCSFSEFFNGAKIKNYLAQVIIITPGPFTPFNVVIKDAYGRVLHSSAFDGIQAPFNPSLVVASSQMYPVAGSTVTKKEMVNSAMYILNILNKNNILNIASNSDYMVQNAIFPTFGTIGNGTYIGFTPGGLGFDSATSPITSHIQIIDSQGAKRVGGDSSFSFIEKNYDTIAVYSYSLVMENAHIGATLINAEVYASLNPNTYISNENTIFYKQVDTSYPWSFSYGTIKYHRLSSSYIASPYKSGSNLEVIVIRANQSPDTFPNSITNYIEDKTNPFVKKVELVGVLNEKVVLRVYASDSGSGIAYIETAGSRRTSSSDLVYGTIFDGVFETILSFESYYLGRSPSVTVCDRAGNCQDIYYNKPFYNMELETIPLFPSYKYVLENNIDPFDFTSFEFKYNDVDVSNGPFNNTLCFRVPNADKNIIPRFVPLFTPLNPERVDLLNGIPGAYDHTKGLYCISFQIPARMFSGELDYYLLFSPNVYGSFFLKSTIGNAAQLRVFSSFADQMPPIITEFTAYPSNIVEITENSNIGWNIRIEDSPNGFKSAEFNITSDFDLEPYIIRITPANAISGNENSGTYQLRIPVTASTCRSQTFRISSASITDTQGHSSILPSTSNVNPLYKFLTSSQLSLAITCPQAAVDNIPPVLTNFASSANTIDVGTHNALRSLTFTFTTSDPESGISSRHNPYIFLNSPTFTTVKQVSKLVSYAIGVATYSCTIQLPYGYGSYQGILVSVYGIVDNQLNINGYSTTDLQSLGFQSTIKVTYSNNPVLDTTSAINSTGTSLEIYGHKFGIDSTKITLQVDYQNGQGWKNTPLSLFSGIVVMTNSITPTSTPFYVRVIVDGITSNSLLVIPSLPALPCSYVVEQTIVSTWINSEIYPFLQASITIKNTGNKALKLFSFKMDNIDQIWGVDTAGNRYTLPSWHSTINAYEQYTFGYIIKGTTVGELKDITLECLV
ncbi:hypothetical protein DICPUDRAFT_78730 [Dictyostelium purpureum]|uniref:Carbohydrate binding domain-containing protein n=1 Tax=Dictyostelium purpureum TaxID=5786 RepID=F0ZKD8_DICPU|nr:uncharacterized protein DICPUDRAFT_78730 [Dictyostelium purpureum]EGC35575.1 hypothetical protein DICPUDRAFT_78730 [Dictyostelium purpureum]|eukprot:XP_003287878.1 hypothetical protein DICPUDRAFT_78730 [Dictyostelium purpureum]